jgi:hypothetical protein
MPHLADPRCFSVVAAAVGDSDRLVREVAGHALIAIDSLRAGDLLAAVSGGIDRPIVERADALTALRALPTVTTTAWTAVVDCLGDPENHVRGAALGTAAALAARPGIWWRKVSDIALAGVSSDDPYRREISLALARQLNAPGYLRHCRLALNDPHPMVRDRARHELMVPPRRRWWQHQNRPYDR